MKGRKPTTNATMAGVAILCLAISAAAYFLLYKPHMLATPQAIVYGGAAVFVGLVLVLLGRFA